MKLIIDDMDLKDIRAIGKKVVDFLKSTGYGVITFEEIRDKDGDLKGIEYDLYPIDKIK